MSATREEFLREWPVPDEARMGEIIERVLEVAGRPTNTPEEYMLMDLFRGYAEAVKLIARQHGIETP